MARVGVVAILGIACHSSAPEPAALDGSTGSGPVETPVSRVASPSASGQGTSPGSARDAAPSAIVAAAPPAAHWATWPMPNAPSSGLPNPRSYDSSAARTVLDNVTGLMWQRSAHRGSLTFDAANAACAELDVGDFHDWRLPSRIELASILDLEQEQPSIDPEAFPRTAPDWFWTSSVAADSAASAWYVYFYFGYPKTDDRSNAFAVRCVRTARPPREAFDAATRLDVRAEVVRDRGTGLNWQRRVAAPALPFEGARKYCSHLDLDGHKDWRLPSMPELLTVVDEGASDPSIDSTVFPETPADSFWTGTFFVNKTAEAWHVFFGHGNALYGLLKAMHRVRCVR